MVFGYFLSGGATKEMAAPRISHHSIIAVLMCEVPPKKGRHLTHCAAPVPPPPLPQLQPPWNFGYIMAALICEVPPSLATMAWSWLALAVMWIDRGGGGIAAAASMGWKILKYPKYRHDLG